MISTHQPSGAPRSGVPPAMPPPVTFFEIEEADGSIRQLFTLALAILLNQVNRPTNRKDF